MDAISWHCADKFKTDIKLAFLMPLKKRPSPRSQTSHLLFVRNILTLTTNSKDSREGRLDLRRVVRNPNVLRQMAQLGYAMDHTCSIKAELLCVRQRLRKQRVPAPWIGGGKKQVRHRANVLRFAPLPFPLLRDRKSTRLNSSHLGISYAVF